MKLDWKRAGCASIAECGQFTAIVWKTHTGAWAVDTRDASGKNHSNPCGSTESRAMAEASFEDWLNKIYHPEWREFSSIVHLAEWRGAKLAVLPDLGTNGNLAVSIFLEGHEPMLIPSPTVEAAKAAAEKWVREQTA